jgi:hypothetical protein
MFGILLKVEAKDWLLFVKSRYLAIYQPYWNKKNVTEVLKTCVTFCDSAGRPIELYRAPASI